MIYSFIGMGKPISVFNNTLKARIKNYKSEHGGTSPLLVPGGIYAADTSKAAMFAAENDMNLYVDVGDLLSKSDIIFLFLSDKALSFIASTLMKYPVKGKIFCHFSPSFRAGVLDFDSANTYACMHLPYYEKTAKGTDTFGRIMVEGYGKGIDSIAYALGELGLKCTLLNDEEMLMYRMAMSVSSNMTEILMRESRRMIKYSLASDKDLCNDILDIVQTNREMLNSDITGRITDDELVKEQCRILKRVGMNRFSDVYASLMSMITEE